MSEPIIERATVVRAFSVELGHEGGDGRTVEARIVPYNTTATVSDPPHYKPYLESWMPGCFERQTRAAGRVKLLANFEHEDGLRGIVGHGTDLIDRGDDALYGVFRIHANADGDKLLNLIDEDIVGGVSLEAVTLRSVISAEGVVQRVRAHLDKVSFCRTPAFSDARVLAVREAPPLDPDDPDEPPPPDEPEPDEPSVDRSAALDVDVSSRLEALGFESVVRLVSNQPWDSSADRFTDEEYARSCLVFRDGDEPTKARYSLPVLEPSGEINADGVREAARRLNNSGLSVELRAQAARKLIRYYRQLGEQPPPALVSLARR